MGGAAILTDFEGANYNSEKYVFKEPFSSALPQPDHFLAIEAGNIFNIPKNFPNYPEWKFYQQAFKDGIAEIITLPTLF